MALHQTLLGCASYRGWSEIAAFLISQPAIDIQKGVCLLVPPLSADRLISYFY